MKVLPQTSLLAVALIISSASVKAQRQFRTHLSPSGPQSSFGRTVVKLGDIDADGISDYAISGPGVTLGGNGAGAVVAYSGSNGTTLWTASGSGGWNVCGQMGTTGDFFGDAVALVPDQDGDGLDDLAVGSPFAGVPNGSCKVPNYGQMTVVSSATGSTIFSRMGLAANDFYGSAIGRVQDLNSDGTDEFGVAGGSYLDIIDGASGLLLYHITLPSSASSISGAGDFNGDGFSSEVAVGDPFNAKVWIVDVLNNTSISYSGPQGSLYGQAIEVLPPYFSQSPTLLVGAPGDASGAGAVYRLSANANMQITVGTPNGGLGNAIAVGGNADGSGISDDVLVGASIGNYVRIMDVQGLLIDDVTAPGTVNFGTSVAWYFDQTNNSFDEFLVGDPSAVSGLGQGMLLYGGPGTTLNQNYGPGCAQCYSPPVLTQSTGLIPGQTYSFTLSSGMPPSLGSLYMGLVSSVGITLPPCTLWLDPNFGPFVVGNIFTNQAGFWQSPTYALPFDINLLGFEFGHQALLLCPTPGKINLSNATSSVVGW